MGAHHNQMLGFAKYNREFNQSLLHTIAQLSDSERKKDRGAFFGSIHATLNHILLVDRIWLARFAIALPELTSLKSADVVYTFTSLGDELYCNFDDLIGQRQATDKVIQLWVEELSDALLGQTIRYSNSKGLVREHPVWLLAAHLFNHQTHHRGQITTLLNQLGLDVGVTDYFAYI